MSSATQGSNDLVRGGRTKKTDKTRRSWSTREEEVLMAALKELVAQGWKSDNGFRAGYLSKLEEAMRKEFPTTDLKGMPHINSKTTTWKKNYSSLHEMFKITGVGFNVNGTHMIDCTDEQWEGIVRKDSNARLMRYKSWPLLDDWKVIFGKDRANGDTAEDMMEAAHEMYRNINLSGPSGDGEYHVGIDDMFEQVDEDEGMSQTKQPEIASPVINKKRKAGDGFSGVCDILAEMTRATNKRLETIASRIGHDVDVSVARNEVFGKLSALPGLSQKAKFVICDLLAKESERLDIFTSLPDADKLAYVNHLLEAKYNT